MKKFKKQLNTTAEAEAILEQLDEDKVDVHGMDVVVERVEGGLVGSLRIEDKTNHPIFKINDYALIRTPSRLLVKDFVLYNDNDNYYLRRIIKFKNDDIYVAGDHEKEYHIIHKQDIVGKVISRERKKKRMSFSLTPKKKLYTFRKVNLAYFRLKNRIATIVDDSIIDPSILTLEQIQSGFENKTEQKINLDLDSELSSFLNPDTLVLELRQAMEGTPEVVEEEIVEEEAAEVEYVEEDVEAEAVEYVEEEIYEEAEATEETE